MADELIINIGKTLARNLAKDMWDQVNSNEYGDAEKSTQAILTAIKDAKHNIIQELTAVMLTQELSKYLSHIETWTEALADYLLAKHNNEKDADEELDNLDQNLEDTTDGIAFVLNRIDSILRQKTSISNQGLIKLGCQRLDEELVDPKKLDKDMYWYMMEMNKFLTAVIHWQIAGLALRLFTACGNQPKRDRYAQAWKMTIDAQLEYTYQSYHPMIKSFKFSFWDKIPDSRLWRFRVPKPPDWLFIKRYESYLIKGGKSGNSIFTCYPDAALPGKPNPAMHFNFSPTFDKPNSQNQSGQWSYLQNADAPGKRAWGLHYDYYDFSKDPRGARTSGWTWEMERDMPGPWVCPRFKLCPVNKESRLFKMVAEAEAEYRAQGRGMLDFLPIRYIFWDDAFEADHVEGSG